MRVCHAYWAVLSRAQKAGAKMRPGDPLRGQVVLRGRQVESDRRPNSVLDCHESRPRAGKFHLACQEPRAHDDGILGTYWPEGNPASEAFGQFAEALKGEAHGLLAWAHPSLGGALVVFQRPDTRVVEGHVTTFRCDPVRREVGGRRDVAALLQYRAQGTDLCCCRRPRRPPPQRH